MVLIHVEHVQRRFCEMFIISAVEMEYGNRVKLS